MGWLSYVVASEAREEVGSLEERVIALESRIQVLEYEVRSLKTK